MLSFVQWMIDKTIPLKIKFDLTMTLEVLCHNSRLYKVIWNLKVNYFVSYFKECIPFI